MQAKQFYTSNIENGKIELTRLKKTLLQYAMLRLLIFLSVVALSYFFRFSIPGVVLIVGAGMAFFLLFVSRFTDAKLEREYYKKYVRLNEIEINALNGDFSTLKQGVAYMSESHFYNQDIDLFGQGSIFQVINRTETENGEKKVAAWLNSNDISAINEKQTVIKELADKADWRQNFQVTASLIESENQMESILDWIKNYRPHIPKYFKFIPLVFSVLSVLLIVLYSTSILEGQYLLYWFFFGLMITGRFVKKTTTLYNSANKTQATFQQYSKLLAAIENETFVCEQLIKQQNKIKKEGLKASYLMQKFSKSIDHLGQRNNLLFSPVSNGFFLWDILSAYRVEKWLLEFNDTVANWFEAIEYFDAANSMGNFAFNQKDYVYPTILSEDNKTLVATQLGHPLLQKEKLVSNDIIIGKEEFFIITGANMAGKSTFLRTVALNFVMANCGLPVRAKTFEYQPIKLISSMRTSDSLQNDESYFFSELKRLKFIVDQIKTDRYFIILDEILKGTNSKDKAEGSKKFIEKLVQSGSTGIVATHDLSLCSLSDELAVIKNYYFDAEIVNNELYFDYTFKKGICQNMNASFLLKKMEII